MRVCVANRGLVSVWYPHVSGASVVLSLQGVYARNSSASGGAGGAAAGYVAAAHCYMTSTCNRTVWCGHECYTGVF